MITKNDLKHLDWIYLRLKHVHNENENLDYMIKFKSIIDSMDVEDDYLEEYNPYCKICNSCGEEGCCPPTICSNHPDGKYCRGNMDILRSKYFTLRDLYNELCKNKKKNKEIIDLINSLEDKNDEIFGVI